LTGAYQFSDNQWILTWFVNWKDYKSITTWAGQSNGKKIIAQYMLKVFGDTDWDELKFTGGQDEFKKEE
jgi:Avidin family